MTSHTLRWLTVAGLLLAVVTFASSAAMAQTVIKAAPFQFVGTDAQCGGAGTGGAKIVSGRWVQGLGLPDDGVTANPDGADAHNGLLLSKNGPTANCSSAGARIAHYPVGLELDTLGFDYRGGGHCGAGAPRFNVTPTAPAGRVYFFGCGSGQGGGPVVTPAPQDAEWVRVRFTPANGFCAGTGCFGDGTPAIVFGAAGTHIKSISIVFDEGTETTSLEDPNGVGLAVIDNIAINDALITSPLGDTITDP